MIKISVIEYLGKIDNGVIVLFGVSKNEEFYEATYFYNKDIGLVTFPIEVEISDEDKTHINEHIKKIIMPYDEIINLVNNLDLNRWLEPVKKILDIKKDA